MTCRFVRVSSSRKSLAIRKIKAKNTEKYRLAGHEILPGNISAINEELFLTPQASLKGMLLSRDTAKDSAD